MFYELELDRANQTHKVEKPDPNDQFNPSNLLNAVNCFKDVSATATFGKFGVRADSKEGKK